MGLEIKIKMVEKEPKRMPLTRYVWIANIFTGIGWLACGISRFFNKSTLGLIIGCIAGAFTLGCILVSMFCRKDEFDEMAEKHSGNAGYAVMLVLVIYLAMMPLSRYTGLYAYLAPEIIGNFGLALIHLVYGTVFIIQEKAGV